MTPPTTIVVQSSDGIHTPVTVADTVSLDTFIHNTSGEEVVFLSVYDKGGTGTAAPMTIETLRALADMMLRHVATMELPTGQITH